MSATIIEWPEINTVGWVRLANFATELPVRFEDVDNGRLVIGVPFTPSGNLLELPDPNTEFFVGWTIERAVIEVPVALRGSSEERIPTWTIEAIGEPTETQRRNFVRVEKRIEIELDLFEGGAKVKAITVDISEGGLRALIDKWAVDPGLREFNVSLPLPEGRLELLSQVVWWGNLSTTGSRTIGVRFVDLETRVADTIRRQVFAFQLEQRRNR